MSERSAVGPPSAGRRLSDSRLANVGAKTIHQAFITYRNQFQAITQRARRRFAQQDWPGMQADASERLVLYRQIVDLAETAVRDLLGDRQYDKFIWAGMKAVYSGTITDHDDWELAETFFNSITRRLFATVGVDPRIEFVDTDFETPPTRSKAGIYRTYGRAPTTEQLMRDVLEAYTPDCAYRNVNEDAALVARAVEAHLDRHGRVPSCGAAGSNPRCLLSWHGRLPYRPSIQRQPANAVYPGSDPRR